MNKASDAISNTYKGSTLQQYYSKKKKKRSNKKSIQNDISMMSLSFSKEKE